MSVRAARALALAFFVGYTVFLTWPGALPFNRIRPMVLGLPFSMFWVAAWVAASFVVLGLLHRAEGRARRDADGPADGGAAARGPVAPAARRGG